eukprot:m.138744 g.138744  ORF g.138744 m.138744 type:complete len:151 (+) comp38256_c0_seq4:604-1056(+)
MITQGGKCNNCYQNIGLPLQNQGMIQETRVSGGFLVTSMLQCLFETRVKFLQQFEKYKRQAISLQADIKDAKAQYGQALENLEAISIEIHEGRQAKKLQETIEKERPRNMGDGAEDLQAELDEVDGAARKLAMCNNYVYIKLFDYALQIY